MIKTIELLVCDKCNCVSTGNPEEKVPCMECGEAMARVKFVRQTTQGAVDCHYCHCTTVILRDGVNCINCGRVYKSHSH